MRRTCTDSTVTFRAARAHLSWSVYCGTFHGNHGANEFKTYSDIPTSNLRVFARYFSVSPFQTFVSFLPKHKSKRWTETLEVEDRWWWRGSMDCCTGRSITYEMTCPFSKRKKKRKWRVDFCHFGVSRMLVFVLPLLRRRINFANVQDFSQNRSKALISTSSVS